MLIEYARRSFAPHLVVARKAEFAEKKRLLAVVANLPERTRKDLEQLVQWTARFLGASVMKSRLRPIGSGQGYPLTQFC